MARAYFNHNVSVHTANLNTLHLTLSSLYGFSKRVKSKQLPLTVEKEIKCFDILIQYWKKVNKHDCNTSKLIETWGHSKAFPM